VKDISSGDDSIDVLYWVAARPHWKTGTRSGHRGCQRAKEGRVNFGILGAEEKCCGDPARRIGNEYLYQLMAMQNIETLKQHKVKKVVTSCPHCFNTFKERVPRVRSDFEVVHHSQFIADLIQSGKLEADQAERGQGYLPRLCYLGRTTTSTKRPGVC